MINNNTQIAYLCHSCQEYEIVDVSLFDFSGTRQRDYICHCGQSQLIVTKNANKTFKLEFLCPVCREKHSYTVTLNQFFSQEVFSFSCPFYEAEVIFLGASDKLEGRVYEYVEETLNFKEEVEYPLDSESLEGIIKLSKLVSTEPDKIRFCDCGGSYSVAYNEKAVYIICDECNLSFPVSVDHVNTVLNEILK